MNTTSPREATQARAFALSLVLILALVMLTACSDNDHPGTQPQPPEPEPATSKFDIRVTNLTANQPLSPIALLTTDKELQLWQNGSPASLALERLAEGGDNSELANISGVHTRMSAEAPLAPGMTQDFSLNLDSEENMTLALVTMLVNTNDAFSGIQQVDLSNLAANESLQLLTPAYDAGTEANSETKGSIPGPADGGEGFNSARDDVDRVHLHPGVISADDGLADSVLAPSHRFDNPVLKIVIYRKS
ncbi:spondin domain-containing protein [Shewanella algae]